MTKQLICTVKQIKMCLKHCLPASWDARALRAPR